MGGGYVCIDKETTMKRMVALTSLSAAVALAPLADKGACGTRRDVW